MANIDKIDRKILSILQGDARIANVELAERIGLSPTSIGERLKRLQRDGFIEGYGARLNPHRLWTGAAGVCRSVARQDDARCVPAFCRGRAARARGAGVSYGRRRIRLSRE